MYSIRCTLSEKPLIERAAPEEATKADKFGRGNRDRQESGGSADSGRRLRAAEPPISGAAVADTGFVLWIGLVRVRDAYVSEHQRDSR